MEGGRSRWSNSELGWKATLGHPPFGGSLMHAKEFVLDLGRNGESVWF